MKKVLALLFLSICTASWALPIAYEPFKYPLTPTNLVGNVNSDGFKWDQAGPTTGKPQPTIFSGSLSYPGLAAAAGNCSLIGSNNNSMAARFSLKSAVASGTLYYSFLVKITDTNGMTSAGSFFAGFNNSSGSQTTVPGVVGTRVLAHLTGTGFQIGLVKASSTASDIQWPDASYTFGTNDTLFVVGSYTFNTSSTSDDVSQMWINPDASTFGSPTPPAALLTSTAGSDLTGGQIASFCLFNRGSTTEARSILVDQLTIGTSWADVTLTNVPLAITSQPKDQRCVVGGSASFNVSTFNATSFQWHHNGVDITGATQNSLSLTNVQVSDGGTYSVTVANGDSAPLLSSNATLTVFPDVYPRLVPLWSLAPGSRSYLTTDSGNAPNQRSFAYNSLSNQVLLVSRTNTVTSSTNPAIYVLHGDTGADLYQMNADSAIITGGANNGSLSLNCIDVSDDGSVFAANVSDSTDGFNLYYWTNSDASTPPQNVLANADPSQGLVTGGAARFGDSLAVRGAGPNTQIMVVNSTGVCGSLLTPQSGQPLNVANWNTLEFTNASGGSTGGRTLLFFGSTNTVWEKYGGSALELITYDTTSGVINSSIITNIPNVFGSPNLVAFDANTNILFGIDYNSSSSAPDSLDQYDLSDPSQPLFVRSYNFPVNHQANANGCGRVVVSGDRVYALDANNGMVAYRLEPVLSIRQSGANVVLAWPGSTPGYTLKATPSLNPPVTWTNVSTGTLIGQQFFATNSATAGALFYRLQK